MSAAKQPPVYLLDARYFHGVADLNGIRRSEQALILAGQLTPITVGRKRFYDWRQVLPLMPESERGRYKTLAELIERETTVAGGAR